MGREDADSEVAATGSPGTVSGVAGLGEPRQAAGQGAERCAPWASEPGPPRGNPQRHEVDQSPPPPSSGACLRLHLTLPGSSPGDGGRLEAGGAPPLLPCSRACAPGPCECPFLTAGGRCAWRPREASRGPASRAAFWTLWRTSRRSGRGRGARRGGGAGASPRRELVGPAPLPASSFSWSGVPQVPSAPRATQLDVKGVPHHFTSTLKGGLCRGGGACGRRLVGKCLLLQQELPFLGL